MLDRPWVAGVFRVLFVVAALGALWLALRPSGVDPFPTLWDKYKHAAAFGTLAFLAVFAFPRMRLQLIVERLSFLGALIEVMQAIPFIGRHCDIRDWLADTVAVVVVVLLVGPLRTPEQKELPSP